ncbi:hypothetical protein LTR28_010247 [Elasticomyces elasticus]|nr:hypothetical protein LTR28_010247 [Elasticomyces elasticus]
MLYISTKKKNPEAAALLIFMAILGPWQIPMSLFSEFQLNEFEVQNPMDKDTKALMTALKDHTVLRLALDDLASVCLVKVKRDRTLSLHGAVCECFSSARGFQSQPIERSYLAPLDRCKSLLDKHIPTEALSPPGGRFCVAYAEIAAHLAQAYLYEGRLEEAKKGFRAAIESERISQGDSWPSTETSLTLLRGHAAACQKSGDLEVAEELLKSALTLSEKLYDKWDPRTAAISSHLKAVSERRETMLQHHKSAVVSTVDSKLLKEIRHTARTPENAPERMLSRAFQTRNNEEDYRDLELEERAGYNTELLGASYQGDESVVKLLLGLEIVEVNLEDNCGRTSLWWAALAGHEAVVKLLLAREDVEADLKDFVGWTPLWCAAVDGHEAVVKLLVARDDVEADSKDAYGRTPLSWAAGEGQEAIVKLLVARDDVIAESKDVYGRTPLSWAAESGHGARHFQSF